MKYSEFNEQKKHGTDGFPIEFYYVTDRHPQYEMPLHRHKEFEIIRVTKGFLRLYLNGVEYNLSEGDIAFVNCSTLHRSKPKDCIYECVVADLNLLRRTNDDAGKYILPIINGKQSVNPILHRNTAPLYSTAESLFYYLKTEDEFYKLQVVSRLFSLFFELYRSDCITDTPNAKNNIHIETLTEILDYIEDNFNEHITLSMLSAKAGFNEKYFCRIFKISTGKTPIEYINELKINNACRLLSYENASVTEAGIQSGFSDMSYFSKVFKTQKHCTPREWRNKAKVNHNHPLTETEI